jgi:pyruvate dehydrogenase E2 component (dihydrolipoamide acetyltransferase)
MAREFKLPDLGEGIHEGEIISVLVSVGDAVTEGDPIMEVETDKATVELPSPYTGKVAQIMVKPGDLVRVGDVMLAFEVESDTVTAGQDKPPQPPRVESDAEQAAESEPSAGRGKKRPVPASPSTRRLARELGVDLHRVAPSGPSGLVTAEDVRAFAAQGPEKGEPEEAERPEAVPLETFGGVAAVPKLPDFSKWGPVEAVPLRSIRRVTARQMTLAWSQIPHVSMQDDIDVSRLESIRRRLKPGIEEIGSRLTLTVFAVKAVAATLKKHPQFCVSVDPGKGVIIRKNYIHVGVAADTGRGLVVPVIRDADRKSITEIALELKDLLQRTRERKVAPEELAGGVFTVTNIGAAGGRGHFSPMINYPEAAILGMSQARMQPVVVRKRDGRYGPATRLIMPVVLAIDHRVLDGIDSARFLEHLRSLLENPEQLLISI